MFLYFEHEKFNTFLLQLLVLNSEFLWQLQCKDINSRGEKYACFSTFLFNVILWFL